MLAILSTFFGNYYKQIIIAIIALLLIVGAYLYWNHMESKITNLTQENAVLNNVIKVDNATIADLQKRFQQVQQNLNQLNTQYLNIDKNSTNIDKQFNFGTITPTNEKKVETSVNTLYNNIFKNLMTETQSTTFSAGK